MIRWSNTNCSWCVHHSCCLESPHCSQHLDGLSPFLMVEFLMVHVISDGAVRCYVGYLNSGDLGFPSLGMGKDKQTVQKTLAQKIFAWILTTCYSELNFSWWLNYHGLTTMDNLIEIQSAGRDIHHTSWRIHMGGYNNPVPMRLVFYDSPWAIFVFR